LRAGVNGALRFRAHFQGSEEKLRPLGAAGNGLYRRNRTMVETERDGDAYYYCL